MVVTWVPTIVVGVRYNYKSFSLSLEGIFFITWSKNRTHRHRVCLKCGPFCFMSTEARWPIRDGDREGRGRKSEGSTSDTAQKRPERPWTAARTMEMLRRCPIAIAQRLVHCAIAVSTAVLGQSHKDNVRCTAVDEQLGQLEAKDVQLAQPSSISLLTISSGIT